MEGNGREMVVRRKNAQVGNGMFVEEGMNEGDYL